MARSTSSDRTGWPRLRSFRLLASLLTAAAGVSCLAFAALVQQRNHHIVKPPISGYQLQFTLKSNCYTSAGIYGSNGNLVRTLWGNQQMAAGPYNKPWDGNDDYGNPLPPDTYSAKLLTHNVSMTWDGTIGNSSAHQTGTTKIHGLNSFVDVASSGNEVYLLRAYNEGQDEVTRFDRATPGVFNNSGGAAVSSWYTGISMATDGHHMYLGCAYNPNFTSNPQGHVIAYDLDEVTGAWTFTGVSPVSGTGPGQNNNGQWLVTGGMSADPTSLAVQTTGNVLAVAENALGQVVFYDKLAGTPISGAAGTLSIPNVSMVRWSPDEKTLWASVGTNVTGWQFNGTAWASVAQLSGTSYVRSFAVNPIDGTVAILYSGTDQQIRAYTPKGTWFYTIGAHGGYSNGPTVNDTKFMILPDTTGYGDNTAIAGGLGFENDGKLWVVDNGNNRALRFPVSRHLAAARKDAEVRMVNGYELAVDRADPTHLIANHYLEFKRDYSQPLSAGEGVAWTLVNNWGFPFSQQAPVQHSTEGITQLITGPNGHRYVVCHPACSNTQDLMELTPTGIRDIGPYTDQTLQPDMSTWTFGGDGTSTETVLVRHLSGFDSNNNPIWGSQSQYCSMPLVPGQPTYSFGYSTYGGMPIDLLPDGSIASFNTSVGPTDTNTHYLGYVKQGATDFWVKAAKGAISTPLLHDGSMPLSALPNPGLIPDGGGRVLGNLVAVFANGEFFDSAEANQILLYHSSGLPITDFGTRSGGNDPQPSPSGKSGNFYGNAFVQCADGNARILHSDESSHGGIHEITVGNLTSLSVASATFNGSNLAIFGTVGPSSVVKTTTPTIVTDAFSRVNSSSVGNGWQDLNSKFQLAGARLKAHPLLFDDQGAVLVRPETCQDSDQTIEIPAQYFDPTKMQALSYQWSGAWGVFSHYQPNGDRYYAEMQYEIFPGDTYAPRVNGNFRIEIGMIYNGQRYQLGFDNGLFVPSTPGHQYSLRLQTTGVAPTHLHLTIIDETTGLQYAVLDQVSDQPELQRGGNVGISGGFANNEWSSYTGTLYTSGPTNQKVP